MSTIRQERLASLLFEEMSIMVGNELDDPTLSMVQVTHVSVSRDLRHAKVHVYHDNDEVSRQQILEHLKRATPFLRSQIAVRCTMRAVPELFFTYDDSPERASRIDRILQQIAMERVERDRELLDTTTPNSAKADLTADDTGDVPHKGDV